jgi:hypothetical protein
LISGVVVGVVGKKVVRKFSLGLGENFLACCGFRDGLDSLRVNFNSNSRKHYQVVIILDSECVIFLCILY